ncbi:MAG: hypothetical protein QNJ51_24870 [Calothrix sp. MO_167.B12]|nr:hypothetical protein [Calothrix sp. MO_167.B12]
MLEKYNQNSGQQFQDFLVEEARLEDVSFTEDKLKIIYLLDGDPVQFSIRYNSISFADSALGSPSQVEVFAVTLAVISFLRFGAVLPRRLDIKKYSKYLDPQLLEFIEIVIRGHWSEHRYQIGKLDYTGPEFVVTASEMGQATNYPIFSTTRVEDSVDVILASGSGKDSLLCSLLLETANIDYDLVTYLYDIYGDNQEQELLFSKVTNNLKCRKQHNLYLHDDYYPWLENRMEKTNIRARLQDYFTLDKPFRTEAGEVVLGPIAIAPIQIVHKIPIVAFGNEKSADAPNLVEPESGEAVAHQWAKSFTAEKEISKLMARLFEGINRVSLTKPLHDLKVFETVFRLGGELPYATNSCNIKKPWCGRCEKCCYVFAGFCTYGNLSQVVEAFGQNLFDIEENLPIWEELLGLKGYIPWECVGQAEEAQFYLYHQHKRGVQGLAIDLFRDKILMPLEEKGAERVEEYFQTIENKFSRVYETHHTMPDWLWGKISQVLDSDRMQKVQ